MGDDSKTRVPEINVGYKNAAILQSNYIPWKGYFDLINSVDDFVLYDDVQYTRRDWRNRNKIKSQTGTIWLTVPVEVKGRYDQKVNETIIAEKSWAETHWNTILHTYRKADCFSELESMVRDCYQQAAKFDHLSDVNRLFISTICNFLDVETKLHWSSDFNLVEGKSERLLEICKQLGAAKYVSGPAAQTYLNEELFVAANIGVQWYQYGQYNEYKQLYPPFIHEVSI